MVDQNPVYPTYSSPDKGDWEGGGDELGLLFVALRRWHAVLRHHQRHGKTPRRAQRRDGGQIHPLAYSCGAGLHGSLRRPVISLEAGNGDQETD